MPAHDGAGPPVLVSNQNGFNVHSTRAILTSTTMTHEEATVPQDESPEHACDYCGHPFPTTDRLALHRGLEHPAHLDEDEEDAFVSSRSN